LIPGNVKHNTRVVPDTVSCYPCLTQKQPQ